MGWLLLGKTNYNKKKIPKSVKSRKSSKTTSTTNDNKWDPSRTIARFKIIGAIALILAVAGAWRYGYTSLSKQIEQTFNSANTQLKVSLTNTPPWMSQGIENNLKQTILSHISPNPLDTDSLRQAAVALSKVAWVKQVVQIKRISPYNLKVYALYRVPMAMVKYGNGYRLVSTQAIELLAKPYDKKQLSKIGLPVITGVTSTPPMQAGTLWQDNDLYAGLALIHLLKNQQFFTQIRAINVRQHDARGRQRLVINTKNGSKIAWGYAPNISQEIEPNPKVKIARLKSLAKFYNGSIDGGAKYVEIYGAAIQTQTAPLKRWSVSNG